MNDTWNKLKIFNSVLSKEKDNKQEAIQFYFQQLWQMDNLIILTGSGFSQYLDGPLMSDLSKDVLPSLIYRHLTNKPIETLNKKFVSSWRSLWEINDKLWNDIEINLSKNSTESPQSLSEHSASLNIEEKISALQAIVSAFKTIDFPHDEFSTILNQIKKGIVSRISQICPPINKDEFKDFSEKLRPYRNFIKRLIKHRRPQQPRVKIFSLNYDTVIEAACDLEGISCITGFEGKSVRLLNPTAFDLDLNFRSTGQASIYYPDVIHLYKLHGSIDWVRNEFDGVPEIVQDHSEGLNNIVIYPCYTKFAEALELPYYEMFRRLGECLSRPQTVVLSIGYGFNDDHINQMLLRAFKNPSCQFVLCEPKITEATQADNNPLLKSFLKFAETSSDSTVTDPRVTILGDKSAEFPEILDVIFHPVELESPTDQIKNLIKQILEIGQE